MREGTLARLRALILLVAFGIGLAGQAIAFAPMAMAQDDNPSITASMGGMDDCPGCAGSDNDASKALTPACGAAFCSISVSPAILPQGLAVMPTRDGSFILATADTVQGISIRPDLGPPRPNHHA
jgi:hypothetical protein